MPFVETTKIATLITSKLTPGKRQRLEQRKIGLELEWQDRNGKVTMFRQAQAIEASAAPHYQLEKQIEAEVAKMAELAAEIDRIEPQLME